MNTPFSFNNHVIKAITVKQPYASLILDGEKDIINRTWNRKNYKDPCKNWLFIQVYPFRLLYYLLVIQ